MMEFELCCDSYDAALIAAEYGFKRIELCAALDEGGLTPSMGMIQRCVEVKNIETHVMIRPRGGSFVYSQIEMEIMARDIIAAAVSGARGVVFGCLKSTGELDLPTTMTLAEIARRQNLQYTFHRAIDFTPDRLQTLYSLAQAGFVRVLTSGGKSSVVEGMAELKQLAVAGNQFGIQVMAGGGVNVTNARALLTAGIHALHFTARKSLTVTNHSGMGGDFIVDHDKIKNIVQAVKE